ncbi:MAG: hypothetical protein H0V40_05670 [Actinobacteria bacterium]|nr:hypothetical protein [Actinomycetota bacterium]
MRLSGRVAGAASGERVVLERRRHGEPGLSAFASVTTTTGGVWSVLLHPRIRTVYAARVGDARTSPVTVEVRPRVGLSVRDEAFLVKVVAARSYEGKYVVLQRLGAGGAWVTLRRAYLGRPPKHLGTDIPAGESRVRAFLPAGQAGPGYVASLSREITFER